MHPENKLFSSGILIGVALFIFLASHEQDFRPENAALTPTAIVVKASYQGSLVADTINFRDIKKSFHTFRREGHPIALWMGASQLHTVCRYHKGDTLAVDYANQIAEKRGSSLVYLQLSSPNASLHDLLGLYLIFRQEGLVPDRFIVAMTYDDLREEGARGEILASLPKINAGLLKVAGDGVKHLQELRERQDQESRTSTGPIRRPALEGTMQERLENNLVDFMEHHWKAYQYHGQLSARIEVFWRFFLKQLVILLSRLKNDGLALVGRHPAIRLPEKIESHGVSEYWRAWNMTAFQSLVRLAKADGVRLLVYKVPHRPDEPYFYYPRAEYDAYFEELKNFCQKEGIDYADWETLIPSEDWPPDGDPFHFQDGGHRRLAAAVDLKNYAF